MYSQEFKEKVLRRYDETHKLATTCREFNIRRETLQRWRRARQEFDEKGRLQFYIQKEMATHYEKLQIKIFV